MGDIIGHADDGRVMLDDGGYTKDSSEHCPACHFWNGHGGLCSHTRICLDCGVLSCDRGLIHRCVVCGGYLYKYHREAAKQRRNGR